VSFRTTVSRALPTAASMAKAYASDAGWRVPDASIQVHGGIGATWEHPAHLYLRRALTDRLLVSDEQTQLEELAAAVASPTPPSALGPRAQSRTFPSSEVARHHRPSPIDSISSSLACCSILTPEN